MLLLKPDWLLKGQGIFAGAYALLTSKLLPSPKIAKRRANCKVEKNDLLLGIGDVLHYVFLTKKISQLQITCCSLYNRDLLQSCTCRVCTFSCKATGHSPMALFKLLSTSPWGSPNTMLTKIAALSHIEQN